MEQITGKKLKEMIKKQSITMIDIDPEPKYKKGHIKGAINVPYNQKNFVKSIESETNNSNKAIALCATNRYGEYFDLLAEKLKEAGYSDIYAYKAGVTEWKRSNLEISKSA